jgi:hypothetical protein
MTIISFIVVGLLSAFGVAAMMEFYKKIVRKGNTKAWENWVIGIIISFAVAAFVCYTGLEYTFGTFFGSKLLSTTVYGLIFFFVQMFLDMNVIKKIILSAIETMDIDKFGTAVLSKFGFTVSKFQEILNGFGVSKDKIKGVLTEAGFSETKVTEIANFLFPEN